MSDTKLVIEFIYIIKTFNSRIKLNRLSYIVFIIVLINIVPTYNLGSNFKDNIKIRKKSLVYLMAKDKIARAMCFYNKKYLLHSTYFKGPSGILIKAGTNKNNKMVRNIPYYEYIDSNGKKYIISFAVGFIHNEQGFDLPVIANINGVLLAKYISFNDGGVSNNNFNRNIIKAFQKLPSGFKIGLKEFYLFGCKSITGLKVLNSYLASIFGELKPYEVYVDRITIKDNETIQNFLSEINYCPSEKLLDRNYLFKRIDSFNFFYLKIKDKTLVFLYNHDKNKREIFFKSSNNTKIKISLYRNKFLGSFIKFVYKENGDIVEIEQNVFSPFFESKIGIPIVYRFNENYIAGIIGNKKIESILKPKIEKEIKNLPIRLQECLKEFSNYIIKTLYEVEKLNFESGHFFGTLLNKKNINARIIKMSSEREKNKILAEFIKIYGEKK